MVIYAERILSWCRLHESVSEQPRGSNDGAALRYMLRDTAFQPGDRWCMFFCEAAIKAAIPDWRTIVPHLVLDGSCASQFTAAKKADKLSDWPATGCIALYKGGTRGHYHAGIVMQTYSKGASFLACEGNTNNSGAAEGFRVCTHIRQRESADFVIW